MHAVELRRGFVIAIPLPFHRLDHARLGGRVLGIKRHGLAEKRLGRTPVLMLEEHDAHGVVGIRLVGVEFEATLDGDQGLIRLALLEEDGSQLQKERGILLVELQGSKEMSCGLLKVASCELLEPHGLVLFAGLAIVHPCNLKRHSLILSGTYEMTGASPIAGLPMKLSTASR
ncbi:hypothetical protein D3C86_1608850 [compost metagenome]